MHAEDMDLSSYPVKATRSPQGKVYDKPKPATHVWKINYLNSIGEIRHDFWKGEIADAVSEIPEHEILVIEKRMIKPQKIVSVSFGLMYEQEEPGGEWKKPHPNDKDPRAEKFYEGDYTRLYMEVWRKNAYQNGEFDALKLTRSFSKEAQLENEKRSKDQEIENLRRQLEAKTKNEELLKSELAKSKK